MGGSLEPLQMLIVLRCVRTATWDALGRKFNMSLLPDRIRYIKPSNQPPRASADARA